MELQFEKTPLPCLRILVQQAQQQEQTQEVKLPDGMPDIGRILACRGQVMIRGKQWNSDHVSVSGGIMAWVLYVPEEGGDPRWVESWLPFQMKWEIPGSQRDGSITLQPLLSAVDARAVSARKILVRGCVSIHAMAVVEDEAYLYTPDATLPEDVQILKHTYPVCVAKEAGEKLFLVDEQISLPGTVPAVEKVICYTVCPSVMEQKVMGDKVVFRGTAALHLLYMDPAGKLCSWDFEMPFSQYAELTGDYAPEATCRVELAVTSVEFEPGEDGSYHWKTGITGQYMIYDHVIAQVVADAYSPGREIVLQGTELALASALDMQSNSVQLEQQAEVAGTDVVEAVVYQEHPSLFREADQLEATMEGQFQVLAYDEHGQLYNTTQRWENTRTIPADKGSALVVSAHPATAVRAVPAGGATALYADVQVLTTATANEGIPMVTGMELGEQKESDPGRPALILRRAGEDTLWQIAKETGSTVEAIRNANGLQEEPLENQMLLIPVP